MILYVAYLIICFLVIGFIASQVVYPMFSLDVDFFWIFKTKRILKKHEKEIDDMYSNKIEKEINNKLNND